MKLKEIIQETKGKFFTVNFIKKDGSKRHMLARTGVKKYLKGGESPAKNRDNMIVVFDVHKRAYRMINLDTLLSFKCGNKEYYYY
tara:strand:+ start:9117 stop:9371 length:255 start_codon:yes stop_codon:yes gene_type:complete